MPARSLELVEIGYFLSREGKSAPPTVLRTTSWYQAYLMFYNHLNGGRTPIEFEHSLKNIRDQFDGHFPMTMREGWKNPKNKNEPAKLSATLKTTFHKFENVPSDEIWNLIRKYADFSVQHSRTEYDDAFLPQRYDYYEARTVYTEGNRKAIISNFIERNLTVRRLAIKHHGLSCAACGFNFGQFYGHYAKDFIEIHHLTPLHQKENGNRQTNYKTDVLPLCSNCHSVVHRKKDRVLSLDEIIKMIDQQKNESPTCM